MDLESIIGWFIDEAKSYNVPQASIDAAVARMRQNSPNNILGGAGDPNSDPADWNAQINWLVEQLKSGKTAPVTTTPEPDAVQPDLGGYADRKSTRLNSSHRL